MLRDARHRGLCAVIAWSQWFAVVWWAGVRRPMLLKVLGRWPGVRCEALGLVTRYQAGCSGVFVVGVVACCASRWRSTLAGGRLRCAACVGVVWLYGSRGCVVSTCRARVCGDCPVVGVARQGGAYGSGLTVFASGRRRGVCCLRSVLLLPSSLVTCGRARHRRHHGQHRQASTRFRGQWCAPRTPATRRPHRHRPASNPTRSRHAARRDAPVTHHHTVTRPANLS